MNKKLYYKSGVDISSTKSMCEFLLNHFQYYTMNSWNGLKSIANNVKLYNLQLEGDWAQALELLYNEGDFAWLYAQDLGDKIAAFQLAHPDYEVGFNGRSDGYLVLYRKTGFRNILPNYLDGFKTYEEVKDYLKDFGDAISNYKYELRELTNLVRDFDKLCDDLRDITNEYSLINNKESLLREEDA